MTILHSFRGWHRNGWKEAEHGSHVEDMDEKRGQKQRLFITVFVDDVEMAGKKQNMVPMCKTWMKNVVKNNDYSSQFLWMTSKWLETSRTWFPCGRHGWKTWSKTTIIHHSFCGWRRNRLERSRTWFPCGRHGWKTWSKTTIILHSFCGWHRNGWKEAAHGSHVEDMDEKRGQKTKIILHSFCGWHRNDRKEAAHGSHVEDMDEKRGQKQRLFITVFVDDIEMAGNKQNMVPMWKTRMKNVVKKQRLFITVFVDDIEMAGKKQKMVPTWKTWMKNVVKNDYSSQFLWMTSKWLGKKQNMVPMWKTWMKNVVKNNDYSSQFLWMTSKWLERSRTWFPCGRHGWKTWSKTTIIHHSFCGWHRNGWKEAEHGSHVEDMDEKRGQKQRLFITVFVDDIGMAGKKQNMVPMWKTWMKNVVKNNDYSSQFLWMTSKWLERSRTWFPCGRHGWKTWSKTTIIHHSFCGWHRNDWKEAEHGSHVEDMDEKRGQKQRLFITVFVDDIEMDGKKQNMVPMWKTWMKNVVKNNDYSSQFLWMTSKWLERSRTWFPRGRHGWKTWSKTTIIHHCFCGWHRNDWKEAEHGSHVEDMDEKRGRKQWLFFTVIFVNDIEMAGKKQNMVPMWKTWMKNVVENNDYSSQFREWHRHGWKEAEHGSHVEDMDEKRGRKQWQFFTVFVDDIEMAGKKQNMVPMWKTWMKNVVENNDYSSQFLWMTSKWLERSRTWFPCGRHGWKTWSKTMTILHSFRGWHRNGWKEAEHGSHVEDMDEKRGEKQRLFFTVFVDVIEMAGKKENMVPMWKTWMKNVVENNDYSSQFLWMTSKWLERSRTWFPCGRHGWKTWSKTTIILHSFCGWHRNGWKEAEHGSHVEDMDEKRGRKQWLFFTVFVDDIEMAGKKQNMVPM